MLGCSKVCQGHICAEKNSEDLARPEQKIAVPEKIKKSKNVNW
jgi:hypothetical protein